MKSGPASVAASAALSFAAIAAQSEPAASPPASRPPNVIVVISDDAGYADFGMQGSEQIATPHIDSIAANGVRFAQGYVTASVCSPSRAGLLTGRYQQRFGHEFNIPPRQSETNGLPVEEATLADAMRAGGLRTIGLGKWHLGYAAHFHPLSRGFDEYFGFLQGARSYVPLERPTVLNRLLRGRRPAGEEFTYLTDTLGDEAARHVGEHRGRPFFLYLAFNAVHTPMHADDEVLAGIDESLPPRRRKLIAMTVSLDRAVGRLLAALREHGIERDTLLFFVNDNGGATNNASSNGALRGRKGSPFEGGIRVPFAVQWPAGLPAGVDYPHPVSTLDVLPTALAAAGGGWQAPRPLDGADLLPYLRGERDDRPHERLFWRRGANRAVRAGDWKWVVQGGGEPMLFDLAADPGEREDRAAEEPERAAAMAAAFASWEEAMQEPRWRMGRRR